MKDRRKVNASKLRREVLLYKLEIPGDSLFGLPELKDFDLDLRDAFSDQMAGRSVMAQSINMPFVGDLKARHV